MNEVTVLRPLLLAASTTARRTSPDTVPAGFAMTSDGPVEVLDTVQSLCAVIAADALVTGAQTNSTHATSRTRSVGMARVRQANFRIPATLHSEDCIFEPPLFQPRIWYRPRASAPYASLPQSPRAKREAPL